MTAFGPFVPDGTSMIVLVQSFVDTKPYVNPTGLSLLSCWTRGGCEANMQVQADAAPDQNESSHYKIKRAGQCQRRGLFSGVRKGGRGGWWVECKAALGSLGFSTECLGASERTQQSANLGDGRGYGRIRSPPLSLNTDEGGFDPHKV